MVERLRAQGIRDERVLAAMQAVPRHAFVDEGLGFSAYDDTPLPIGFQQTISQPFVVARMLELLRSGRELGRTLEVGAGCGYQAAVLSRLCRQVLTLERFKTLADIARARLERLECHNVDVRVGDGFDVPKEAGLFDRILVTAAMEQVPEPLLARLDLDGILLAPVGPQSGAQNLVKFRKSKGGMERKELVAVRFVPALPGIAREL